MYALKTFGAVDKTSSSFSAHGKIGNFIIIIILVIGYRYYIYRQLTVHIRQLTVCKYDIDSL